MKVCVEKVPVLVFIRGQLKGDRKLKLIIIDNESKNPLYIQIYEQIKEQIIME